MAFCPSINGYPPDVPQAMNFLLLTEELFITTPRSSDTQWFCMPISGEDARLAKLCSKTRLLVPLHAQVVFDGKVYASGWEPTGKPDWWQH